MALRPCDSAHCSGADPEINEICKREGWPVNHPVLTRDANGPCYCSCSCLAFGTPVQAADRTFRVIESYEVGDNVLACGIDLQWEAKRVAFSGGTTGASRQKYTVLLIFQNRTMAVTSDHLFLMADKHLKRADRLAPGDYLLDDTGNAVPIHSVHIGDYTAGFHHIATSKSPPDETLAGHLLNTNGVVSADYAVQLYASRGSLHARFAGDHLTLPIVGSPEYVERYGDSCLHAPASMPTKGRHQPVVVAQHSAKDLPSGTFVPAALTIVKVPPDACGFISNEDAAAKKIDPRRPWNDPQSREWVEYLLRQYKAFYPSIVYTLDWANDTVNAFAWIDSNGIRNVVIEGGLVRHWALELEGIALVLGHETAHHYGGPPTFPGGLSCEGQADYYGVAGIMRNVWFGEYYLTITDAGIQQMANFFGVPNDPTAPGGSAGCNHPPGACRIATYHAAVDLRPKPGCAS